jgi:hypothetical protein
MNLKDVERRAWRSTFQDGLLDIFLGLLLLAMAAGAWISDNDFSRGLHMGVFIGLEVGALLAFWLGKRFITVPRMGLVKFGPKGKARKRRALWVGTGSVLVGLAFLVISLVVRGDQSQRMLWDVIIPVGYVLNMLVIFSLGAYFLDVERLYFIGLMYALPIPMDMLQRGLVGVDLTFLAFGIPAVVVLVMGGIVLRRFLRNHPIPVEAPSGEGEGNDE